MKTCNVCNSGKLRRHNGGEYECDHCGHHAPDTARRDKLAKKVLKFTATYIGIKDLHQITEHSEGRVGHVRSKKGSESTITDGTVTMYTSARPHSSARSVSRSDEA